MKQYKDLTFVDDFMFAKVMRDKGLCKRLLEVILGVAIREIRYLDEQKTIDQAYDGKSVRLDVYVEDDQDTVYDCEMQATNPRNLPRRSRYYQGMIDLNHLEKGEDYNELKRSVIIFICMEDVFGLGLPSYDFEYRCAERPELVLGDGTRKIFLNAGADMRGADGDLANFLRYLKSGSPVDEFTATLDAAVARARDNQKWEVEYMKFMAMRSDLLAEGREEGRKEGRKEERANNIETVTRNLLARNPEWTRERAEETARMLFRYTS